MELINGEIHKCLITKEYLTNKYPEYNWESTSLSGDGNKDVLCKFRVLEQEMEYWAEAKFTKGFSSHKLQKGQLDPTLVSALLSPKQVSILFVSNSQMTNTYLYRLNDFTIKTNIGVKVVLKDEFEQWLLEHPFISEKYNLKIISMTNVLPKDDICITSATITDIFNSDQYKVETHLVAEQIYYLYIIVILKETIQNVSLKTNDSFAVLNRSSLLSNPHNMCMDSGKHVYKFEIVPQDIGELDLNIQLVVNDQILTSYLIKNIVINPNFDNPISYTEQEKAQFEIVKIMEESSEHNIIIPVLGNGSCGKSRLIQNIYLDMNNNCNIMMLSFNGNEYLDMKVLIQMFIFFNIGYVFDYEKESLFSELDMILDKERQVFYARLLEGFFDNPGEFIDFLDSKMKSKGITLLYPSYTRIRQILILDDIHKLSEPLLNIFHEFLDVFLIYNNNQSIIMTSREYYNDFTFNSQFTFDSMDWVSIYHLHGLSKEDKLRTLNSYISFDGNIDFNRTTDDVIVFSNILNKILKTKIQSSINQNLLLKQAFENPRLVNTFLYKEQLNQLKKYNDLIECVFYIDFGIDFSDLIIFFQYKDIKLLIERRIFKRVGEKIYPFHDYYVKAYFENNNITDSTINILKQIILHSEQDEKKYLYLSLLIESDFVEYYQIKEEAHELAYHYFEITDYYKSYALTKSFKKYINFDEKLSFQEIYDLFIFAVSSGYFEESKMVQKNYDTVVQCCNELPLTPDILGIILRSQSEIINIDYWELKLQNISKKIDTILADCKSSVSDNSKDLICAYLNLLNRKMVVELLFENYDMADEYFKKNLKEINIFGRKEYEGYLYMDYAKGLYNKDLEKAISYMQSAKNIFEVIGTEHRRLLDCTCEIEYLKCIQSNKYDIRNLEYAAEALNNSGFIELYAKARLKLAAIKMTRYGYSKEDIEQELALSRYVLKYSFTGRLSLLYKMLQNAQTIYGLPKNHLEKLTPSEQKALRMMGRDYQNIWEHNSKSFKNHIVFCSNKNLQNEYILDARIW